MVRWVGVKSGVIEHHEGLFNHQREAAGGMANTLSVLNPWGSSLAVTRNPCTLCDFNC